ncbi:MAG: hypothetical protein IH916_02135 [Acidobacteria bacterium]|nr:hypothetical protein [Acidobacteriota bacterium]MCH7986418.1 hypothetical protein [Acidobacteriota bacterium]
MSPAPSQPPMQIFGIAPAAELFYNLAALGAVAACAYFFFWGFVLVVGPALLLSLILMLVERIIA